MDKALENLLGIAALFIKWRKKYIQTTLYQLYIGSKEMVYGRNLLEGKFCVLFWS